MKQTNVGIRFDSEEIDSLLINVTSNFKGKLPSTLSLTGRLGKRYTAGINYAWEPAPLKTCRAVLPVPIQ